MIFFVSFSGLWFYNLFIVIFLIHCFLFLICYFQPPGISFYLFAKQDGINILLGWTSTLLNLSWGLLLWVVLLLGLKDLTTVWAPPPPLPHPLSPLSPSSLPYSSLWFVLDYVANGPDICIYSASYMYVSWLWQFYIKLFSFSITLIQDRTTDSVKQICWIKLGWVRLCTFAFLHIQRYWEDGKDTPRQRHHPEMRGESRSDMYTFSWPRHTCLCDSSNSSIRRPADNDNSSNYCYNEKDEIISSRRGPGEPSRGCTRSAARSGRVTPTCQRLAREKRLHTALSYIASPVSPVVVSPVLIQLGVFHPCHSLASLSIYTSYSRE